MSNLDPWVYKFVKNVNCEIDEKHKCCSHEHEALQCRIITVDHCAHSILTKTAPGEDGLDENGRAEEEAEEETDCRGIQRRINAGLDPKIASVASIFVSRWDKAVMDKVRQGIGRENNPRVGNLRSSKPPT